MSVKASTSCVRARPLVADSSQLPSEHVPWKRHPGRLVTSGVRSVGITRSAAYPIGCARREIGCGGVHGDHMNTTQGNAPKKSAVGITRIIAVSAVLGLACAAGTASAVAATPVSHVATKAAPAGGEGGDVQKCGVGILNILNLCN